MMGDIRMAMLDFAGDTRAIDDLRAKLDMLPHRDDNLAQREYLRSVVQLVADVVDPPHPREVDPVSKAVSSILFAADQDYRKAAYQRMRDLREAAKLMQDMQAELEQLRSK